MEISLYGYNPKCEQESSLSIRSLTASSSGMEMQRIFGETNVSDLPDSLQTIARLYQNVPNPFTQNTVISFYIPAQSQSAHLYIYNLSGLQLRHIPLSQRGNASVIINGNEFQAGMYLYSLVIDDRLIDTKRMVLTD